MRSLAAMQHVGDGSHPLEQQVEELVGIAGPVRVVCLGHRAEHESLRAVHGSIVPRG